MPDRIDDPFLFDPADFWGSEDVKLMDDRQALAYLKFLSYQWSEGSLPPCARKLAGAVLSSGVRHYSEADVVGAGDLADPSEGSIWAAVAGCFEQGEDGRFRNPRIAEEREEWLIKKASYSKAGSIAGKASAKARRKKAAKRKKQRSVNDPSTIRSRGVDDPSTGGQRSMNDPATILNSSSSSSSSSSEDLQEAGSDAIEDVEVAKRALTLLAGGRDPIGVVRVDYGTIYSWLEQYRQACPKIDPGRALLDDLHAVAAAGHGPKIGAYIWRMLEPLIGAGECGNLAEMRKPAWKKRAAKDEAASKPDKLKPGESPYDSIIAEAAVG